MSDPKDWWREHLNGEESVLWHSTGAKNRSILTFRLPFLFLRGLAILLLVGGALMLLSDLVTGILSVLAGIFVYFLSDVCKLKERLWRDDTMFVVTPNRALVVAREAVIDEVEINKFLQFEPSITGIHFPRRMEDWPFIEDHQGAYEALKQAQRLHQ